jgi:uncharacterized protein YifN (PemK superfamily)
MFPTRFPHRNAKRVKDGGMALQFHPKPGAIVMAQFPDDFLHGEMEKRRPVIVISTKAEVRKQRCATVVPLSLTAPYVIDAHHVVVPASDMPKGLRDAPKTCFAKCDCVNTLSLERLDLVAGPRVGGKRSYVAGQVSVTLLLAVRKAVAGVLGIHAETFAHAAETLPSAQALTSNEPARSFADVGNNRPSRLQRTPRGA